jgi:hypothetical protein
MAGARARKSSVSATVILTRVSMPHRTALRRTRSSDVGCEPSVRTSSKLESVEERDFYENGRLAEFQVPLA